MSENKIRAIVIDDEQEGRDVLINLLRNIPEIELIGSADGADTGLLSIIQKQPDLVFLDIHMPRRSGLAIAKDINTLKMKPSIVFVTAYDQYAIEAIRLAAFDFLLKPVDPSELEQVIKRFKTKQSETTYEDQIAVLLKKLSNDERIRLNTRSGFILIEPSEIIYIHADGNYSEIVFSKTKKELVTMALGQLSDLLPAKKFIRGSRSNLLNIDHIRRVDRKNQQCELEKNGEIYSVHISRDMISNFDQIF